MSRSGTPSRRRGLGSQVGSIGIRWALGAGAIVFASTVASLLVMVFLFQGGGGREFVVVYEEVQRIEQTEVDGRSVSRRSTTTEASRETTRFSLILPVVLVQNGILLVVLSALALLRAHQITGPVYRISTDIRRAMSGETGVRIQLREKDELKELAQRINSLLAALDGVDRRG